MANSRVLDNELREKVLQTIMEFYAEKGEDVMQTNSNECAFPCVDSEGNDKWIQIVIKVPSGARDEEGYDGYGVAESYKIKVKEKAEKKKKAEEEKAKKIEKDNAKRKNKENGE